MVNEAPRQHPDARQENDNRIKLMCVKNFKWIASLEVVSLSIFAMLAPPVQAQTPANTSPATAAAQTKPEPPAADKKTDNKTDDTEDYRVGVGDAFEVAVLLHPELSKSVTVGPDGRISYPYLGYVMVSGLNLSEFSSKIQKGLAKEIEDPQVTITLTKRADRTVSIFGAVRSSGKRIITGEYRILDLLADSGGLAVERPDLVTANLIRKNQPIPINLTALLVDNDTSQNLKLEPGDILNINLRDQTKTHINVTGAVQKPGWVPVPVDGSLQGVLTAVGGATPQASLAKAFIKRDGTVIPIDLTKMDTNVDTATFIVKPGDILFIPLNQKMYGVFGAVNSSRLYGYPEDRSLSLIDAITSAGGLSSGADLKHATLIRSGAKNSSDPADKTKPQKEPEILSINLDAIFNKKDISKNIAVVPGDVIYIPSKEPSRAKFGLQDALGIVPLMRLFVP